MRRGISILWLIPTTILYISIFLLAVILVLSNLSSELFLEYLNYSSIVLSLNLYLITLTVPLNTLVNYMLILKHREITGYNLQDKINYILLGSFIFPYITIYTLHNIAMTYSNLRDNSKRMLIMSIISFGLLFPIWLYDIIKEANKKGVRHGF